MTLDPNSGEFITLAQAQEYVYAYRIKYPDMLKGFFAGGNNINKILCQHDCIGIRIYNGYDNVKCLTNLVIVGVDGNQKDMTGGLILEKTIPCPSTCDITSSLYS